MMTSATLRLTMVTVSQPRPDPDSLLVKVDRQPKAQRGKEALYNFLSTFSGTHFLQPRTLIARIGLTF